MKELQVHIVTRRTVLGRWRVSSAVVSVILIALQGTARATIYTYQNASGSTLSTDQPLDETRIREKGWILKNTKSQSRPLAPPAVPSDSLSPIGQSGDYPRPAQKLWALATTAILSKSNGESIDVLGGKENSPHNVTEYKKMLEDWWNVKDRHDLLNTLAWLEQEGHSKYWNELAALTPSGQRALLGKNPRDWEIRNKMDIVVSEAPVFKGKSLRGWDYARYISLCRWGYSVGYFSEDEAWRRIMPVAKTIQRTFDSWEELGKNYLIGRAFWSSQQLRLTGKSMFLGYDILRKDPQSPWKVIPWNLNLN